MSRFYALRAPRMHRISQALLSSSMCLMLCGCSVMMAARAPGKKDLKVLTPGVSRSQVVAELGPPIQSRDDDNGSKDVFAFKQGYSTGTKVTRSIFHGAADFLTIGFWEFAGTPLESSLQGEDVRAEVAYDPSGKVSRIEFYAGAHLANGGPTLAPWMRGESTRQSAVIGNYPNSNNEQIIQTGAESPSR